MNVLITRPAIVGREEEATALAAFLAGRGEPRALVLTGEAGMGKTTLWQAALATAQELGIRVLAARASEVGGTFTAGATDHGGVVHARLPL